MLTGQRKQICVIFLIALFLLNACVRPDKSPSPFEALFGENGQKRELPTGPVDGLDFPILPDSELVFGPSTVGFSIRDTVAEMYGYLASYEEMVDDVLYSGAEIIEWVSRDYSVHPRLLLAVLDLTGGWVSEGSADRVKPYPVYPAGSSGELLFTQLSYVADTLNRGYYSRRVGGMPLIWTLDGVEIIVSQTVNDATVAVQYLFSQLMGYYDWQVAAGPLGISVNFKQLFGDPFDFEVEELIPNSLIQPEMMLPFRAGGDWFFTSGPHSAWGSGAAWAALDFAPDEEGYGCYESTTSVTAVADGLIAWMGDGIVVQDLDGDGEVGTGWTVLYMHIADKDKMHLGEYVRAGEPIGHPSCEGGPATGTHLHIARRYNGEWIPADQTLPFILSGWTSQGGGVEYDGSLIKAQNEVEASGFPTDENKINK